MVKRITNSLLVALCSIIGLSAYGQEPINVSKYELDRSVKEKKHHTKIRLINGNKVKAVIRAIDTYSLQLENVVYKGSREQRDSSKNIIKENELHYRDIQKIKIRNAGASFGGFVVGTTAGAFVGGLIGFLSPCDDCDSDDRVGKSIIFAGLGSVILGPYAAFDGPFIVNMEIAGDYSKYETFINEMERRRAKKERNK